MDKNIGNGSSENPKNKLDVYWDAVRDRKYDHSFPAIADWITEANREIKKMRLRQKKRRRRLTWFAAVLIPAFLVVSCTYRVERVEKSGTLINFGIDEREKGSFQMLSSLQQMFTFKCYEFLYPGQSGIVSFISFIPGKEQDKALSITRQIKLLHGLRKLDISPVKYNIRESLFLTFFHRTLRLGKQENPRGKELVDGIRAALNKEGLGFLSINVLNDSDANISFTPANRTPPTSDSTLLNPDSLAVDKNGSTVDSAKRETNGRPPTDREKLQLFNWLLGTWKVKFVPHLTYHHWMRMNDSSLICYIIKYQDDEPDISVGFSIKYSATDSAILSFRGIEWTFVSANDKEIIFKNEITPKSANVKWSPDDKRKNWESVIFGEKNMEVVNLVRDENTNLENIVKDFISKHPDKLKL